MHFWAKANHFHFCIALIGLHCDELEATGYVRVCVQYSPAMHIPYRFISGEQLRCMEGTPPIYSSEVETGIQLIINLLRR